MTQCGVVIGLEDQNGEPKNYIEFSEYRKLYEENISLREKIKELEERLDNKDKVNKQLREELGKFVMNNPS